MRVCEGKKVWRSHSVMAEKGGEVVRWGGYV